MNEREIITLFSSLAGQGKKELVRGIGDDCAVLRLDGDRLWLVTTDTLVESVHFDLSWHPPELLGRKSVAVNVSDIAAMGGKPSFVFLSLGMPKDFSPQWLEQFALGMQKACLEYNCCLAGGDTVRTTKEIMISLTVIGEVPSSRILYRKNAAEGDEIWVSGTLGKAAAGLELCQKGRVDEKDVKLLVDAHLNPSPRVALARDLSACGKVRAMMDISDGLATDLAHICEQSGTGARIYSDLLPVDQLLKDVASSMNKDFLSWVLGGGEDYELLFTVKPEHAEKIEEMRKSHGSLTRIGTIDESRDVRMFTGAPGRKDLQEVDIGYSGYDHFKS